MMILEVIEISDSKDRVRVLAIGDAKECLLAAHKRAKELPNYIKQESVSKWVYPGGNIVIRRKKKKEACKKS